MNTPNPLIPQGALTRPGGSSNLRVAVITIVGIHVVFFGGLLLQGCKRDVKLEAKATNDPTSQINLGPLEATNTLYYGSATNLPPDASHSSGPVRQAESTYTLAGNDATSSHPGPSNAIVPFPAPTGEASDYTVVSGDSYYKIAKAHGVGMASLAKANPNVDSNKLKVGTKLRVPAPEPVTAKAAPGSSSYDPVGGNVYMIKSGDTLVKIAKQNGIKVSELRAANGLKTSRVTVGQKLKIPAKNASGDQANGTNRAGANLR